MDDRDRVAEIAAWRRWISRSEDARARILGNVFCPSCGVTEMAPGYAVRTLKGGVILRGECAQRGHAGARAGRIAQ